MATRPPTDETWMTWPEPCSRSTGNAAVVTLTTPNKLASTCARKSSAGVSSTEPELA